jgi:hypothetical protein
MSLTTGEQRILDEVAESMRATEPRLAAMFATFTRVHRDELAPQNEQLAATRRPGWFKRAVRATFGRRAGGTTVA